MDIELALSRTTNRQKHDMGEKRGRKIVDSEVQLKKHEISGSYKNGWR